MAVWDRRHQHLFKRMLWFGLILVKSKDYCNTLFQTLLLMFDTSYMYVVAI